MPNVGTPSLPSCAVMCPTQLKSVAMRSQHRDGPRNCRARTDLVGDTESFLIVNLDHMSAHCCFAHAMRTFITGGVALSVQYTRFHNRPNSCCSRVNIGLGSRKWGKRRKRYKEAADVEEEKERRKPELAGYPLASPNAP